MLLPVLMQWAVSVVMHAPAVFKWTASASPERHRMAAQMMGATAKALANDSDVGKVLADRLRELMRRLKGTFRVCRQLFYPLYSFLQ